MNYPLIDLWENWKGNIYCNYTNKLWTGAELRNISKQITEELLARNFKEGEIIGIALSNTAAFPIIFFALLQCKCNPLLINPSSSKNEFIEIAKTFNINYILHDFLDGVSRFDQKEEIILYNFNIDKVYVSVVKMFFRNTVKYYTSKKGIVIHQTSGTYGQSNYCFRSQTDALNEAKNYADRIDIYKNVTLTITTPLHHAFAYGFGLMTALLTNSSIRLYTLFNPRLLLRDLEIVKSDILLLVPPMISALISMAKEPILNMPPYVFYAGSSCSNQLKNKFETLFKKKLYQIYGTTETGGISTSYFNKEVLPAKGLPLKNVKIEIKENHNFNHLCKIGEIWVSSNSMMTGYTHSSKHSDTFFFTGDIGFLDEDNNVQITGRSKDIINVHGSKIDPSEIEELLLNYPGIEDVSVYPGVYLDDKEIVQAALVTSAVLDLKELTKYCYDNLSSHKVPLKYHLLDSIPRSPAGKCLKLKLPEYKILS